MNQAGVNFVKFNPEQFFAFLRENNYPVYYRSPIFFRDFQYGLWRFLQESQTKVAYADIERIARDVIDDFEKRGLVRKISRQNYELQMEEFTTVFPTMSYTAEPTAPAKPIPAAKPAAAPAAAAPAAPAPAAAAGTPEEEKARKIAELQAKMAAAKAAKEGGTAAPASAAPAASAPAVAETAAAAPAVAAAPAAPLGDADKAARLAELKVKMEEAKRRRESGETSSNS